MQNLQSRKPSLKSAPRQYLLERVVREEMKEGDWLLGRTDEGTLRGVGLVREDSEMASAERAWLSRHSADSPATLSSAPADIGRARGCHCLDTWLGTMSVTWNADMWLHITNKQALSWWSWFRTCDLALSSIPDVKCYRVRVIDVKNDRESPVTYPGPPR